MGSSLAIAADATSETGASADAPSAVDTASQATAKDASAVPAADQETGVVGSENSTAPAAVGPVNTPYSSKSSVSGKTHHGKKHSKRVKSGHQAAPTSTGAKEPKAAVNL